MAHVWATLYLALMLLTQALHVFGLPANWALLLLAVLWKWTHPEADMTGWFFFNLAAVALVGEIVEFFSQMWGTKRFGGTSKGMWAAFIGAIVGAIMGAPFLFGLGSLAGALAGGFAGGFVAELAQGRPLAEANRAAWGGFWGRVFGLVAKVALGMLMFVLTAPRIWP